MINPRYPDGFIKHLFSKSGKEFKTLKVEESDPFCSDILLEQKDVFDIFQELDLLPEGLLYRDWQFQIAEIFEIVSKATGIPSWTDRPHTVIIQGSEGKEYISEWVYILWLMERSDVMRRRIALEVFA